MIGYRPTLYLAILYYHHGVLVSARCTGWLMHTQVRYIYNTSLSIPQVWVLKTWDKPELDAPDTKLTNPGAVMHSLSMLYKISQAWGEQLRDTTPLSDQSKTMTHTTSLTDLLILPDWTCIKVHLLLTNCERLELPSLIKDPCYNDVKPLPSESSLSLSLFTLSL